MVLRSGGGYAEILTRGSRWLCSLPCLVSHWSGREEDLDIRNFPGAVDISQPICAWADHGFPFRPAACYDPCMSTAWLQSMGGPAAPFTAGLPEYLPFWRTALAELGGWNGRACPGRRHVRAV